MDNYVRDLPKITNHPYWINQVKKLSILDYWGNFLTPGDFQSNHIHNNSWLSGVYYLDEPKNEKDNNNAGWIEFNRSGYNLPRFGGEKEIQLIRLEIGMFIMFPSYVWHGTIPYTTSYTRGNISFDINIK
mgnify:CR=1 FL=1